MLNDTEKTDKLKDKDGRAKGCHPPSIPSEVHIMNFLEERIVKDGKVKPNNVLKVDSSNKSKHFVTGLDSRN